MKLVWFCILSLLVLGCSNLGTIKPNYCGNGVIDPGEDCDTTSNKSCGKPGGTHPCRFICQTDANCPTGYFCGHDGVCREPTGLFDKGPETSGQHILSFATGDVDGDGNDDIISESKSGWIDVAFLVSGKIVGSPRVRSATWPFAVGQLTSGDTRADIAHLPGAKLDVLTGQSNRTLAPQAYADLAMGTGSASRPILFTMEALRVTSDMDANQYSIYGGQELLALHNNTVSVLPQEKGLPAFTMTVNETSEHVAQRMQDGGIPVARLDETKPCLQFVLAKAGANVVSVYSPCVAPGIQGWNTNGNLYPQVKLPGGATVGEGVIVANMNPGDTYPDLLIAGASKDAAKVPLYVAYGRGDGTFGSAPPSQSPNADQTAVQIGGTAFGLPLAAGDLNLDKVDDFVFRDGIFESRYTTDNANQTRNNVCHDQMACWDNVIPNHWKYAAIADLNHNGLLDVVAVPENARYVDFFNGTGSNLFNKSQIQTSSYPTQVTVGDFDGDLIPDVAITQADNPGPCPSTGRSDQVSVLFGQFLEPPTAPVSMGNLDCVSELAPGNLFFVGGVDWSSDLAALDTDDSGEIRVALFSGSTSRQLSAPLVLKTSDTAIPEAQIGVQTGKFDRDNANADIAVLSLSGNKAPRTPKLWTLPATAEAKISNSFATSSFNTKLDPCSALMTSGDYDGDKLDEVGLVGRSTDKGSVVAIAKVDTKTHIPAIVQTLDVPDIDIVAPEPTRFLCNAKRGTLDSTLAKQTYSSQVQSVVLDRNKSNKAVILALGTSSGHQVLDMFSWPGAGQPIKKTPLKIPEGIDPLGFVAMDADSDPEDEILLATQDSVVAYDLDTANDALVKRSVVANITPVGVSKPTSGIGISGMLGLQTADFNGDGVPDLVVGRQSGFMVFYGRPRNP